MFWGVFMVSLGTIMASGGVLSNLLMCYNGSFPGGSGSKASACSAGDLGSISGSGRSPGEVNGNPLQYPCLENPVDGGAWQATVHGVVKSWTTERLPFPSLSTVEATLPPWTHVVPIRSCHSFRGCARPPSCRRGMSSHTH